MFLHAIFPQSLLEDRLWMIIKYSSHMLPILFNKPFKTDGWPDESTTEQIRGAILQHCLFWSPLLLTTILQCKKTRIYVQYRVSQNMYLPSTCMHLTREEEIKRKIYKTLVTMLSIEAALCLALTNLIV